MSLLPPPSPPPPPLSLDRITPGLRELMQKKKQALVPVSLLLPADGGLAVGRPLGGAERLAHLGLGQAQGQPADLERFGKLADLLQVDAVHLAGRRLRVCNATRSTNRKV